jgi:hypothetical protein
MTIDELDKQLWGKEFEMLLSNITNQMRLSCQDPNVLCNYTFETNTSYYLVNEDNYKDLFLQLKLLDWSKMEYSEQRVPIQPVYWSKIVL